MLDTYIFGVALGLCITYFFLMYGLAIFFERELPSFTYRSLYSLGIILLTSVVIFIVIHSVENRELANRIEHAFGGGFLAFLMCYLVIRDSGQSITRFQFFTLAFLVVTALGVANELLEFTLQRFFDITLARTIEDTWLDLASNTVGALVGALCFMPLVRKKEHE